MIKYLIAFAFIGSAYADPALILCNGKYALCAASPTTPTGKTIVINGVTFQEGVSVCPVLTGESIGNRGMIKSCNPPKGQNTVWSLFSTATEYPQAPSWAVVKSQPRTFVTTEGTGGMSNQWSYPCVIRPKQVNGATLADCLGPINESPWNGAVVPVGANVVTAAPIGSAYPVGGNLPSGIK
jgi:hypothetical protein